MFPEARMTWMRCVALVWVLWAPSSALAQSVLLQEILPELEGSALGQVVVADAPAAGQSVLVRGDDIRRALKREGLTAGSIRIPKQTRISREQVQIDTDE